MENIEGKVVVITGASSGFGKISAEYLSERGALVALGARSTDKIEKLAKEINDKGGKAIAVTTDVKDKDQVKKLVDEAVKEFGKIDVMLNNAGIMPLSPLENLKIEDWDSCIDINIKGVLYGIAAALPHMKEKKSGQIINVSSVAGHTISPGSAVYSATKHAVRVISEGLRQEVKPYNIRTSIISPGAVDTGLPGSVTDDSVSGNVKDFYKDTAISADSFARALIYAISQPEDVDINEILYRPTKQKL
ncbi:SDR family oxidoreductase [Fulvivirga sediminis]|uniref:SDR family oxidoreductase n=1 Tax=Fulvivirga sediminis TaxID=2803949 RepID=A0A937F789_9BACT|nr:SDR family oxidoreductase [Fulvivirga sediminis]MBL3657651.1 SDR family oxidoreductase [Fulvivirga sediminis]